MAATASLSVRAEYRSMMAPTSRKLCPVMVAISWGVHSASDSLVTAVPRRSWNVRSEIPASAPDFFTEDTPTAVLVRQVLGAISQFEKASAAAKLAAARKRKRELTGKCEGRKSHQEKHPEMVALARKLRRKRPKGGQLSVA